MRHNLLAALSLALAAHAVAQPLLLTHAHVLSEDATAWREGLAVLVEGDRIAAIAPEREVRAPAETERLDLQGAYLIPGLIDLHTHLLLHPYNETKWDDQVLKESLELRTVRAVPAAEATLRSGFTTVRDLGTEGAGFADVALRDAIRQGIIPGPRIFAATRAIVATGCYGPAGFDPRWQVPKGAQEASGPDTVRTAVREQLAAGADWIKLYADYRRAPGEPSTPTFTLEELSAAASEAHAAGKPCAAHATTDEGIRRAVLAGFDTIEHGYGASRETLELMKQRGTVLVPTMAAAEAIAIYSGYRPAAPGEAEPAIVPGAIRASLDCVRLAHDLGVTIACGTDAGVFRHGDSGRELVLLTHAGFSNAEALRSATVIAAHVLHQDGKLGVVAEGAGADLVVLGDDPLKDIGATRRPTLVISRGKPTGK